MSRSIARAALAITLFASACSQTSAPIELNGKNVYGNGAVQNNFASRGSYSQPPAKSYRSSVTYASSASELSPAAGPTQQTAAVQSIGISDLAPPSSSEIKSKPVAASAAPSVSSQKVNPWTGKERMSDASPKPAAKLANKKDDGKHKPVKLAGARDEPATGFMWPVSGKKIISGFGPKGGGKVNDGINIASANGEPVWAAADGEVIYVGNELQGYGNMVIVKHAGGKTTTYAHLADSTVDKYDRVKQGDIIGYVGSTGNVAKPQLHFAVRNGKDAVDPRKYLSRSVAGL